MKSFFKIFFSVVITGYFYNVSFAKVEFADARFPELISSPRALAMGNSYIALANDAHSAFYNPAGLGTITNQPIAPLTLSLELNKGYFDNFFNDLSGITNILNSTKLTTINDRFDKGSGPGYLKTRTDIFSHITFRYLSLGFLFSSQVLAQLDSPGGDLEFATRRDLAPYVGFSLSLWGGVFKLGGTAFYLNRRQANEDYSQGDIPEEVDEDDFTKETGFLGMVGSKLTLPYRVNPTLAVVLRNIGASSFQNYKESIDASVSITPKLSATTRMHWELTFRDLSDQYKLDNIRKIGFGTELNFKNRLFFRAGYSDGFGSFGIGFKKRGLVGSLTTYAEDLSEKGFRKKEDRRFLLSITNAFLPKF